MKCFRYNLNQSNQGPAGILPSGSITGIFVDDAYYGAALIDDLSILVDWNVVEITPLEFNTICVSSPSEENPNPNPAEENPNPNPALVQLEPAIRSKYSDLMELIVSPYGIQERETWFIQVEEALKWQSNNAIGADEIPLISAISSARNESMSVIVNNIIQKNTGYRSVIGAILGQQQALIETIWTVDSSDLLAAKTTKYNQAVSEKDTLVANLSDPTSEASIAYISMLDDRLIEIQQEINSTSTQQQLDALDFNFPVFGG